MALTASDVQLRYSTPFYNIIPPMSANNNMIPVMTSNTTPSPFATIKSGYIPPWDAWYAFCNPNNNGTHGWQSLTLDVGWVGIDFGANNGKIITLYTLVPFNSIWGVNNQCPKNWTFQGSNDPTLISWTTLDTQIGVAAWTANLSRGYPFANSTAYRYYRINITAVQNVSTGVHYPIIHSLAMTGINPGCSPAELAGWTISNMFNTPGGVAFSNADSTAKDWAPNAASGYFTIDFAANSPPTATRYGILAETVQSPKNWTLIGSTDNFSTSNVTLDNRTNITNLKTWQYYNISSPFPYRYYKFNCTANNGGTYLAVAGFTLQTPATVGNASTGNPWSSLGGYVSTTTMVAGSLDSLLAPSYNTVYVTGVGTANYRCVFICNLSTTTALTNFPFTVPGVTAGNLVTSIALDPTGPTPLNSTTVQAVVVADGTTAPAGVVFREPAGGVASVTVPIIPPGCVQAVWIKLTPIASNQATRQTLVIDPASTGNPVLGLSAPVPVLTTVVSGPAAAAPVPAQSDILFKLSHSNNAVSTFLTANSGGPSPYVITASSEANSAWQAFMAFDNNPYTAWLGSVTQPVWLTIDLGSVAVNSLGGQQVVKAYMLQPLGLRNVVGNGWKRWAFYGSPNASNWTLLDDRTGSDQPTWAFGERRVFTFTNTTPYRYYSLAPTANWGDVGYYSLGEVWLLLGPGYTVTSSMSGLGFTPNEALPNTAVGSSLGGYITQIDWPYVGINFTTLAVNYTALQGVGNNRVFFVYNSSATVPLANSAVCILPSGPPIAMTPGSGESGWSISMAVDSMAPSPVNSASMQSSNRYSQSTWMPFGGISVGGPTENYNMCVFSGALGLSGGVVTAGTLALARPGGGYPPSTIIPVPLYGGSPTVTARMHLQTDATGRVTTWALDDGGSGYGGAPLVGVPAPYNAAIVCPLAVLDPGYCQAVNFVWTVP